MLTRPRLRRNLLVEICEPDQLLMLGEDEKLIFEGSAFVKLAPVLDGRTLGEILAHIGTALPIPVVLKTLQALQKRGCLVEAEGEAEVSHLDYWDAVLRRAPKSGDDLRQTPITVRAFGDVDPAPIIEALKAAEVQVVEEGGRILACVEDYLTPELEQINREALESESTWILAKPVGMRVLVGPIFVPGETGCWKCLEQRQRANRQFERFVVDRTEATLPLPISKVRLPSTQRLAASLVATEVARGLIADEGERGLKGAIVSLDLTALDMARHTLVRRPQCSACGTSPDPSAEALAAPIVLESHPKTRDDGRSRRPDETYQRHKHHVSALTGVVTSLEKREPEFAATHNYAAGHYFPVIGNNVKVLRVNAVARSGGKGLTAEEARTSALCESLERYSGVFWGDEPRRLATYESIKDQAYPVRELGLFSEAQYEERNSANKKPHAQRETVPSQIGDDVEISWTPLWSLTRERTCYVPTAYCYYGFFGKSFFTGCDSNGSAAGNNVEEAIVHGFLELAERDAVAIWWYNRLQAPRVDVESFDLPQWKRLVKHYREDLGREIHVLDLTNDLKIPTFGVVSRRLDRAVEDIILGFASDLNPTAALSRALAEANQYLPALDTESPTGDTLYKFTDAETIRWWKTATLENQPYLVPSTERPTRSLSDFEEVSTGDLKDDVAKCVELAKGLGLETLVLNQTRPDVGLPVVKVVVPGLRHFWRRLAPGRLYDVPVSLGWLPEPRTESEMNPIPCFV